MIEQAQVAAGVQRTIAAYAQAIDDKRADDVIATFVPDGVAVVGGNAFEGHEQLRSLVPEAGTMRHITSNTRLTTWTADEATAETDLVVLSLAEGWRVGLVGRYSDTLRREGDTWLFVRRDLAFQGIGPGT